MYITQIDLLRLLAFEHQMTQSYMRRHCGVSTGLWDKQTPADDMIPKLDKGLIELFGKDYRSDKNINKYLKHTEIVKDFDIDLLKSRRELLKIEQADFADMIGMSRTTYRNFEYEGGELRSWPMYVEMTRVLGSDLLYEDSKFKSKREKVRKAKTGKTKQFITFKNVGGKWQIGRRVVA